MNRTDASAPRLVIPVLGALYARLADLAYPLVRLVTGLWLVPHGGQKLFGWFGGNVDTLAGFFAKAGIEPAVPMVYAVGAVEFVGGLLIAVGLLTRPAALAAFVLLAVAVIKVHLVNGFFIFNNGFEYAMMWAALTVAVAIRGGGRWSMDRLVGKEF